MDDVSIEGNSNEEEVEELSAGAVRSGSNKVRNMTCEMNGNCFTDNTQQRRQTNIPVS